MNIIKLLSLLPFPTCLKFFVIKTMYVFRIRNSRLYGEKNTNAQESFPCNPEDSREKFKTRA